MRKTTSLCFTDDGLINTQVISYLQKTSVDSVVFFSDGSAAAYQHMVDFDITQLGSKVGNIALGKLPLYELRVPNAEGVLSLPQYIYTEDDKIKWICTKVCSQYVNISVSDLTTQSDTKYQLDRTEIEAICYHAYLFLLHIETAENKLCFPGAILDKLTKYSYYLTPETMDIAALRKEVGVESLDYNPLSGLLSVMVAGDLFTVKLDVLNAFYGKHLLPLFNKMYGRRLRLCVAVVDSGGKLSDTMNTTYGELGNIVKDMGRWVNERKIDAAHPIASDDLFAFSKKVKINDDSCIWSDDGQTVKDFILQHRALFVRNDANNDTADQTDLTADIGEPALT